MVEEVEIGEGVGLEEVEMTSQIVLVLSGEGREEKHLQTGNGMSKRKSCKNSVRCTNSSLNHELCTFKDLNPKNGPTSI